MNDKWKVCYWISDLTRELKRHEALKLSTAIFITPVNKKMTRVFTSWKYNVENMQRTKFKFPLYIHDWCSFWEWDPTKKKRFGGKISSVLWQLFNLVLPFLGCFSNYCLFGTKTNVCQTFQTWFITARCVLWKQILISLADEFHSCFPVVQSI